MCEQENRPSDCEMEDYFEEIISSFFNSGFFI